MPKTAQIVVDETKAWLLYQNFGPEAESVTLDNHGPNDVTLGGTTIAAGAGVTLKTSAPPQTMVMNADAVYGRCAAGETATVEVFAVLAGTGH